MEENEPMLSTNNGLSENCRQALSQLEEQFHKNASRICCQRFRLIPSSRNVTLEEQWVYIAFLCTLVEQRWTTKKSIPYTGNETCQNNPIGDIWEDYEFDLPKTTVLNPPQLSLSRDLVETRQREECTQCPDDEQLPCSHCKGRGSIITWTKLNVKWSNNSSTVVFLPNKQSAYVESIIHRVSNRIKCLEFDDIWSSNENSLDNILDRCNNNLPQGFRDEMNAKFLSQQRGEKILRLKCTIERVRLQEIRYRLNGLEDQTFTFYRIGEDRKVYATDESYPSNAQQLKTAGCTLS